MYFDYPGRLGRGRNNGGSLYVIFFIILYCNQVSGVILLIFFSFLFRIRYYTQSTVLFRGASVGLHLTFCNIL